MNNKQIKGPCFVAAYETYLHDKQGDDYHGTITLHGAGIVMANTMDELFEAMAEVKTKAIIHDNEYWGVSYETKFSDIMQVGSIFTHTEDNLRSTTSYAKYVKEMEMRELRRIAEREAQNKNIRTHTEAGEREWLRLLKEKYEPKDV
jgi:hypothetical protein